MSSQLLITKSKFSTDLTLQIAEGRALLGQYSPDILRHKFYDLYRAYEQWNKYNHSWLGHVFSGNPSTYQRDYENAGAWDTEKLTGARTLRPDSHEYRLKFFRRSILPKIEFLEDILHQIEFIPLAPPPPPPPPLKTKDPFVENLHKEVYRATSSLLISGHYPPQAILAACTALEKAIQQKGGQSASVTGTALIGKVFPKDNPILTLSDDQGEREGYGFLYRGLLQAIRNHYAHNLTPIPETRALEWLGFISALFYKLDEAAPPLLTLP